ncbi:hypothetical protein BD779DRAFT_1471662 [Infundibulicybe gibba]|nr:hypothetical protein BD779DRAFT_1471662 [Infundibulicybe gibba]
MPIWNPPQYGPPIVAQPTNPQPPRTFPESRYQWAYQNAPMPFFTGGWGDPMNNNQLIREADGMEIDDLPPPPSSAELERWRDNGANQQPQQRYERAAPTRTQRYEHAAPPPRPQRENHHNSREDSEEERNSRRQGKQRARDPEPAPNTNQTLNRKIRAPEPEPSNKAVERIWTRLESIQIDSTLTDFLDDPQLLNMRESKRQEKERLQESLEETKSQLMTALKKRQASPPTRENEDRSTKKSREATPRDIMPLPEQQQRLKFRPAQNQQPIAGPSMIRTRSSTSSEFVAREAPLPYDEEGANGRGRPGSNMTETTCLIPQSYPTAPWVIVDPTLEEQPLRKIDPADKSDEDYASDEKLECEDTPEEEETTTEKRARQRRNKKKEKKRANLAKENKRKQDIITNIVYVGKQARVAATSENLNPPSVHMPTTMAYYKANRGFPMNPIELSEMIRAILGDQGTLEERVEIFQLVREFRRISYAFLPDQQDITMKKALENEPYETVQNRISNQTLPEVFADKYAPFGARSAFKIEAGTGWTKAGLTQLDMEYTLH